MMRSLAAIWREFIGLFVDDGSLALAVVAWLLASALSVQLLGVSPMVEGLLLTAGFLLLLAENVARAARKVTPGERISRPPVRRHVTG